MKKTALFSNFSRSLSLERCGGFTLIELLIVVSIISLLASIVISSLQGAREGAKDVAIQSNLNNWLTQLEIAGIQLDSDPALCPVFSQSGDEHADLIIDEIQNFLGGNSFYCVTAGSENPGIYKITSNVYTGHWCINFNTKTVWKIGQPENCI